ncbi:ORF2 [Nesidiocoris tenuis virus]|uniref:ORF2 n=1 Tax=Nesidiocoris tenuis virus TaxID=1930921 RepID=UPI0009506BCF|nr:ORF2 [Nesidiocoris tenuis virus]APT35499.1 ORF2 [Nesidiocoris tenuis virus]
MILPENPSSLYEWALNHYSYMIKSRPKPPLTEEAIDEYTALQTIAYHEKFINAIFCPLMREVKKRLLAILDPRFVLFTDMSPDDFADRLTRTFSEELFSKDYVGHVKESDIRKFDKSQQEKVLRAEQKVLMLFGFPPQLAELWLRVHEDTILIDRGLGIMFRVRWHRKSGDASTFLGNSLVLLMVLCSTYDLTKAVMVVFPGDDFYIIGPYSLAIDRSAYLAYNYNFESEDLDYKYIYFCPKFLPISIGGSVLGFLPTQLSMLSHDSLPRSRCSVNGQLDQSAHGARCHERERR